MTGKQTANHKDANSPPPPIRWKTVGDDARIADFVDVHPEWDGHGWIYNGPKHQAWWAAVRAAAEQDGAYGCGPVAKCKCGDEDEPIDD